MEELTRSQLQDSGFIGKPNSLLANQTTSNVFSCRRKEREAIWMYEASDKIIRMLANSDHKLLEVSTSKNGFMKKGC